jgi:hypothetical protein
MSGDRFLMLGAAPGERRGDGGGDDDRARAGHGSRLAVTASGRGGCRGGPLSRLPIDPLRLVVGTLVVLFGLQWLRKAILRAGGRIPLHDEDLIFVAELEHAREATRSAGALDGYSFVLALKSTVLEGVEVVFIVLTLGASRGSVTLAALGAAIALESWSSSGSPSVIRSAGCRRTRSSSRWA